jgi:DedD protein
MVKKPKDQTITKVKLPTGRYTVNVGSFKNRMAAERLTNEMKKKGYKTFVTEVTIPQKGTWYRVSMGRFPTREEAQAFARDIKEKEKLNTFVTELQITKR